MKAILTYAILTRRDCGHTWEIDLQTNGLPVPVLELKRGMPIAELAYKLRTLANELDAGDGAIDAIVHARGPRPHLPAYAAPQLETTP